jgi:AAA family ATP:ADP antiporter
MPIPDKSRHVGPTERRGADWLSRLAHAEPHELAALFWSFAYFFCLLCGYYILRPLREAMGIAGGVQNLPWVFTGTFLAMLAAVPLFGLVTAKLPRRKFLPLVYYFFIANIMLFYALFQVEAVRPWAARAFFIWVSVFNLFVVSVFWSFMVDLFSSAQGKRLFGFIAAGGTVGAITGPALTALLAAPLGPVNLLPVSALLLLGAVGCIYRLNRWTHNLPRAPRADQITEAPLGGGMFAGVRLLLRSSYLLGVALFILLFTMLSTFLYFEQAHIIANSYSDPARRTTLFALMDLAVNTLTVLTQIFITGRLLPRLGVAASLAVMPMLAALGFALLAVTPALAVLVGFQVLRRAGDYAITRPAREVLFTVVDRETKYKAKNFIDTVVYRGGDAVAGWAFAGLKALGFGLAAIAWLAVPIALAWGAVAWWLGRRQETLAASQKA